MKRKIVNGVFLVLLLLLLVATVIECVKLHEAGNAMAGTPGTSGADYLDIKLGYTLAGLLFLCGTVVLLELRHDVLYFMLPRAQKQTYKTLVNIAGVFLSIFLPLILLLAKLVLRPASLLLLEAAILLPIPAVILFRFVCWIIFTYKEAAKV